MPIDFNFRSLRRWILCGASAATVLASGAVLAQQVPASDVTTVSPLTALGVPAPQVGVPVKMYAIAELHQLGSEAIAARNDFEDQRAELDNCYQHAYAIKPNPSRMIGYEEGSAAAREVSVASGEAERATAAAGQARVDAAAGKADMSQVERAELDRQTAVLALLRAQAELDEARNKAIDIQDLVRARRPPAEWESVVRTNSAERSSRTNPLVPKALENLALENIHIYQRQDPKGEVFLTVQGVIHNKGTARADIPALSVTAVDQSRAPLKSTTISVTGKIEPGKTQAFNFDFRPSPPGTTSVAVGFAAIRTGGHLDPVSADPVCQGAAPPELNPRMVGSAYAVPSARTFLSDAPEMSQDPAGNPIRTTTGGQRIPAGGR